MITFWWRIVAGDYNNKLIFQNQVISEGKPAVCINIANQTLKALKSGLDVEFVNFEQWEKLIMDIAEKVEGKEYQLDYTNSEDGKKGFAGYKIAGVLKDVSNF